MASNSSHFTFSTTAFYTIILSYPVMNVIFITSGFITLYVLKYKNCDVPVHYVLQTDTRRRFERSYCLQLQGAFEVY